MIPAYVSNAIAKNPSRKSSTGLTKNTDKGLSRFVVYAGLKRNGRVTTGMLRKREKEAAPSIKKAPRRDADRQKNTVNEILKKSAKVAGDQLKNGAMKILKKCGNISVNGLRITPDTNQ